MSFWINKESETDNVFVLVKSGLVIGSCVASDIDNVTEQLEKRVSPVEVLGSEDLLAINYKQLRSIVSRDTDSDIDIQYATKKSTEDTCLDFADIEQKTDFLNTIESRLPDELVKNEYKQSALVAGINPLISLLFALGISYFYYDRLWLTTLIVGGLWSLASLYMFFTRVTNPPLITKWVISGKYAGKLWTGIKTVASYAVITVIAIAVAEKFPIDRGPDAIISHLEHGELKANYVSELVEKGADINKRDDEGDTPLLFSIYNEDADLVKALIDNGADTQMTTSEGSTPLQLAVNYDANAIVLILLNSNAELGNTDGLLASALYNEMNENTVLALIDYGVNLQEIDDNGENILATAIRHKASVAVIRILLESGFSAEFYIDGITAQAFAKQQGSGDIAKVLSQAKKGLSISNDIDMTPFLQDFIRIETDKTLADKKAAMAVVNLFIDESEEEELQQGLRSNVENTIYYNSVVRFVDAQYLPMYAESCKALDNDLGDSISMSAASYQTRFHDYVKAGKELSSLDRVINGGDSRIFSRDFSSGLIRKAEKNKANFFDNGGAANEELLAVCSKVSLRIAEKKQADNDKRNS